MWETIIVLVIVAVAAAYLFFSARSSIKNEGKDPCSGCSGCSLSVDKNGEERADHKNCPMKKKRKPGASPELSI